MRPYNIAAVSSKAERKEDVRQYCWSKFRWSFGIGCEVSVEDTSFSFDIDWDEGVSVNEGEIDLIASQGNLDEDNF